MRHDWAIKFPIADLWALKTLDPTLQRDRAFVQAFWNLHRESIVAKRDPCTEKYCPLFVTARRLDLAA